MAINVRVNHVTTYRYDRWVELSPQIVRLRPAPHCRTPVLSYSLRVTPENHFVNWQQDPQSNYLARLVFPDKLRELRLEVDLVAELAVHNPFDFFLEPAAERFPFAYEDWQLGELAPFLVKEPATPRFAGYLRSAGGSPPRTVDFLVDLNRRLQKDVRYLIRDEAGVQSKEETLSLGSGSCRDSAWLLVQLLRHMGLAARFVSGYLIQLKPDVKATDGAAGPERDFTDLHAWCEVYLPGAGWIGLDPTSGLLAGEGHLPLACASDPASAAPVTGGVEASTVEFAHAMSVDRVSESPRVTRPYTEPQWDSIVALGHAVDRELERMDVRLTMGGEPTFVSLDDRDGEEWNTAALGPTKHGLAAALLWRLREHYGANGFVHWGQGKWYPGEQLPRWALACYWRRDGQPAWADPALFAGEGADYRHQASDAERFVRALAARLGLTDEHVQAGHEDVWYYLLRERQLPADVDPLDAPLDDPLERDRLRRTFERGLGAVVGYALPVGRDPEASGWRTGPWFLRSERMYLAPGDSPMGLRLPLDSLPRASPADRPTFTPPDPTAPRPPLPAYAALAATVSAQLRRPAAAVDLARPAPVAGTATMAAGADGDARGPSMPGRNAVVRTALCVEPRGGVLHVLMPPLDALEDYLALVASVEATAAELGTPLRLEGYPPPADPHLAQLMVTADPGVIEVNVHPAASWGELVERTVTLYDEARQVRLGAEKFMLDGRHTGTGGGNHMVLGGPTPADSPFLRRPDLLRSLVSYWHNHPSLSYLFAGSFIGPTSQAPRVDEARHDSVYELEIAFHQLPGPGAAVPPWRVDRLFRNLLVDVTGNTHRAEFCINGEFVAGVRFRAWRPPFALHPTIPVHAPLTFDIVDTWMERSLGGCQYHVMHPGGRSYERFPVNSYEAESRRLARFSRLGHTPGRVVVGPPVRTREFPYTLDLRT
jgi:uncharacterized protein (DUF2126 family)/transglutaminase-like putative cysteine protease